MTAILETVRPTTARMLALAIGASVGALLLSNYVLFHGRVGEWLGWLKSATSGWVSSTLVVSLLTLAIFGLVVLGIGRLRPADVGWNARSAGVGLLVTLFALSHIPNHVFVKQMTAPEILVEQLGMFFEGLLLAVAASRCTLSWSPGPTCSRWRAANRQVHLRRL